MERENKLLKLDKPDSLYTMRYVDNVNGVCTVIDVIFVQTEANEIAL